MNQAPPAAGDAPSLRSDQPEERAADGALGTEPAVRAEVTAHAEAAREADAIAREESPARSSTPVYIESEPTPEPVTASVDVEPTPLAVAEAPVSASNAPSFEPTAPGGHEAVAEAPAAAVVEPAPRPQPVVRSYELPPDMVQVETSASAPAEAFALESPVQQPRRQRRPRPENVPSASEPLVQVETRDESPSQPS